MKGGEAIGFAKVLGAVDVEERIHRVGRPLFDGAAVTSGEAIDAADPLLRDSRAKLVPDATPATAQ